MLAIITGDLPFWIFTLLWPVAFFWAGCPCCGPAACTTCGFTPYFNEYELITSGWGDGTCSDCASTLNGTFYLPRVLGVFGQCTWSIDFVGCGGTLRHEITKPSGGRLTQRMLFNTNSDHTGRAAVGVDCDDSPFSCTHESSIGSRCTYPAATTMGTITAVP